jgi:four helix bundle protein
MLQIYEVVLGVIRQLQPVMLGIERHDADLARQMRRASSSVALNVAEGAYSRGKNRPARYQTALGSMRETLACIEVAVAQRYVPRVDAQLLDAIDHVMATLFKVAR